MGMSRGVEVKVLKDAPGPHRMMAWKPGEGSVACGMATGAGWVVCGAREGWSRGECR